MTIIKPKKKITAKRQEFKVDDIQDPRTDFGLSNQKQSLLKYNEEIRTSKSITINDNGRLKIPVFSADPAVCIVGEIAFISGTMKVCSTANTWTAI